VNLVPPGQKQRRRRRTVDRRLDGAKKKAEKSSDIWPKIEKID